MSMKMFLHIGKQLKEIKTAHFHQFVVNMSRLTIFNRFDKNSFISVTMYV